MKRHEIIFALRKYTTHQTLASMMKWSTPVLAKMLEWFETPPTDFLFGYMVMDPSKAFIISEVS